MTVLIHDPGHGAIRVPPLRGGYSGSHTPCSIGARITSGSLEDAMNLKDKALAAFSGDPQSGSKPVQSGSRRGSGDPQGPDQWGLDGSMLRRPPSNRDNETPARENGGAKQSRAKIEFEWWFRNLDRAGRRRFNGFKTTYAAEGVYTDLDSSLLAMRRCGGRVEDSWFDWQLNNTRRSGE